jgi:hypothetical protein
MDLKVIGLQDKRRIELVQQLPGDWIRITTVELCNIVILY